MNCPGLFTFMGPLLYIYKPKATAAIMSKVRLSQIIFFYCFSYNKNSSSYLPQKNKVTEPGKIIAELGMAIRYLHNEPRECGC